MLSGGRLRSCESGQQTLMRTRSQQVTTSASLVWAAAGAHLYDRYSAGNQSSGAHFSTSKYVRQERQSTHDGEVGAWRT